jgi:hypothetical protein
MDVEPRSARLAVESGPIIPGTNRPCLRLRGLGPPPYKRSVLRHASIGGRGALLRPYRR